MEALVFFQLNRQIFGLCPCCGEFFRLSDCNLYQGDPPNNDWLSTLTDSAVMAEEAVAEFSNRKSLTHKEAKIAGRTQANEELKQIDTVFHPNDLSADDAKTIFHPVDFIVFNGMTNQSSGWIEELVFLDGPKETPEAKAVQESIAEVIAKGAYEWITLTVDEQGDVHEQSYWDPNYSDDLKLPSFGPIPEEHLQKYGSRIPRDLSNHDFPKGLP